MKGVDAGFPGMAFSKPSLIEETFVPRVSTGSIAAFGAILALVGVVFLLARLAPQADVARWDVQGDIREARSCGSQNDVETIQTHDSRPKDYRSILFGESEHTPQLGICR